MGTRGHLQANHPHLFTNQGIAFNFKDEIFVKGVGCKDPQIRSIVHA